jgi:hypothetical protein
MTDGDRPQLRLLNRPTRIVRFRSDTNALHPAQGRRRGPVLYICGDHEGRILFARVAQRGKPSSSSSCQRRGTS